jgi:Protein of unknown function (DUF992)
MLRYAVGAVVVALAVASADPAAAQRIKAGLLTCDVSGGIGFIIGSQKQVSCVFSPDQPGPQEVYTGSITKFGLDIGITGGAVMVWGVFTGTSAGPGFFAGDYVLVGGSNRTVALQPISVSGQVGLNLAVGVADLHLRPGR